MARVASSESVRFTPAQRDALISVAARLQAEHEATIGAEELAVAAQEAGIHPRFLGEAATILDHSAAVRPSFSEPLLMLAALALFDGLFLGMTGRHWLFPIAGAFRLPLLLASGVLFSLRFGRLRAFRWIAPLSAASAWFALAVGSELMRLKTHESSWSPLAAMALGFGVIQVLSVAVTAGIAAYRERRGR